MELTTPRLRLREFTEEDWSAVMAYQQDPRYLRYYAWEERSEADVRRFVGNFLDQQREQPRLKWQLAVVRRDDGRLIGNCGVRQRGANQRVADLGYEVAPDEWGQGFATEAAKEMVALGFDVLGVHRIWANCVADNTGSARVLEKLGMALEGRLRENEWFKGRWWDTLVYAILEDEWRFIIAGQE